MRRRSTGTKVLQTIGVLTAWAAFVGFGTFGTFTDLPSRAEVHGGASVTSAG